MMERWTRWCWSGQPIDSFIMNLVSHDGSAEAIARQVYHRLGGRLASITAYERQWMVLFGAVLLAFIGFAEPFGKMDGNARIAAGAGIFAMALLGGALMVPFFMRGVCAKGGDEARQVVERIFIRHFDADTPPDLKDPWRHGWLTADGRPVAAEISEADARAVPLQDRAFWWLPSLGAVACGFAACAGWGATGSGVVFIILLVKFFLDEHPAAQREAELRLCEGVEGTAFVAAGAVAWAEQLEKARAKQLEKAKADKSPLFRIGATTGILAARGDPFAPSKGLPFALSLTDLQMHLLVFGGTGSGKTSGILRPLIYDAAKIEGLGMVVMDGKGALPGELKRLGESFKVINPAETVVSLVAGVEPGLVVDTLVQILGSQSSDRFWTDSAAGLLRHAAILAHAVGKGEWSLMGAVELAFREGAAEEAAKPFGEEDFRANAELAEAVVYLTDEFPNTEERLRKGIIAQARSWIAALTGHRDILKWASAKPAESKVDITDALRGAHIGLLVPAHRYGVAGAVVSALLKTQLYAKLKDRADNPQWKEQGGSPLLLVVDEAQEVATADDASMLAIGRSLGLAMVAATQTVEGVVARLEEAQANKWLSIFGGLVVLSGRSRRTDELLCERIGSAWLMRTEQVNGTPVRDAIHASVLVGPLAASMTQPFFGSHMGKGGKKWAQAMVSRATQGVAIALNKAFRGEQPQNPAQVKLGVMPLLDPAEVSSLLAQPDSALVVATRARVVRRDVVMLSPQYD
jgi:type IV secretory pathway TraG/TraD family ATPase VirD4